MTQPTTQPTTQPVTHATSRLSNFFKDADTELGVFYPKHYLLCAYSNFEDAEHARKDLKLSHHKDEDVIAASGEEVVHFAEEHLIKDGLWGLMMTGLSRAIGTEAAYADTDLAAAKKGAAFVAVLCPTEDAKSEAWKVLEPTHPLIARYYAAGGIEHLAGES